MCGRVMCEHYQLSVLMYTPGMGDFTTGDRYWTEEEDQKKKKKRLTEVFFLFCQKQKFCSSNLQRGIPSKRESSARVDYVQPLVHTARRSYRLNGPVKSCWVGVVSSSTYLREVA